MAAPLLLFVKKKATEKEDKGKYPKTKMEGEMRMDEYSFIQQEERKR